MRGGKRRSARHLQPLLQPRRAGPAPQHNKMANQVNGNAVQLKEEEEPMDTSSVTHTEHYKTLIEAGLPQKVAERLDEIFQT
ncbi:hypothetical protein E2320_000523, partial [Naja naja]